MRNAFVFSLLLSIGLAGCVVPPTPPTPVHQQLQLDPVTGRAFYLYVPSTYRHDKPAPVIVTCHGTVPFDIAEHHIREMKWYGEKNGCIVIAPSLVGTDGLIGGGPVADMLADERYIMSILSLLSYRYNIDRANIMITGFSGGGFPTYWVGLRHPDVFSVIVARNCNFNESNVDNWFSVPKNNSTSVMIYYGQNDAPTIKAQSKRAIRYLKSKGFDVKTAVITGSGHDRHPEVAMNFFRENWRSPRGTFMRGKEIDPPKKK